jgi:hypothetical protein
MKEENYRWEGDITNYILIYMQDRNNRKTRKKTLEGIG